jgi:hypothetical protein
LETAFERRLAALSLAQLDNLGDDRGSRYETLAQLYSHVFVVQDSPRLPAETQAVLLSAIRALVAREPLAPSLKTLRARLTQFERAAGRRRPAARVRSPEQLPEGQMRMRALTRVWRSTGAQWPGRVPGYPISHSA